jgi:hypothetical protein
MVNVNPIVGRLAVIQMNSAGTAVTIGFATGMTTDISAELIKEYALGSDHPAILASGNKSFKVSCDMMYIDNTYASQVYGGAAVTMIIAPAGTTTTGYPKITLPNVILNAFSFKADTKGIVTGKVTGEGTDWQAGNF